MAKKKCQVLHCNVTEPPMYHFPSAVNDKNRLMEWISACGNPTLAGIPLQKMRNKCVCKKHFDIQVQYEKKLSRSAVPTLHLPGMY